MNASALIACSAKAFERRYLADSDPWNFATSAYEQSRYRLTLACLSRTRYNRAFEPGCSVGVLTEKLAERCDEVVATDVSPTALSRARQRCERFNHIQFLLSSVDAQLPEGCFDLIVFSEIGYYFTRPVLDLIAERLARSLTLGGELIAVHWLGHSDDHVLHGEEVHAALRTRLALKPLVSQRHEGFEIDGWIKA